jgi:serine/threonine protein kinase
MYYSFLRNAGTTACQASAHRIGIPELPYPVGSPTIPSPSIAVWSLKSDIWALGCSLFDLYSRFPNGTALFRDWSDTYVLHDAARFVRPLPPLYLNILNAISPRHPLCGVDELEQDMNTNLSSLVPQMMYNRHDPASWPAPNWLGTPPPKPRTSREEDLTLVLALFSMMRQMLRWGPDDRLSAKDALNCDYFRMHALGQEPSEYLTGG